MLAGLDDDLDGIDAGTANLEEVVGSTHLLDVQNIREDTAEQLFLLPLRSHIFCGTLHLGCREHLAVNLAVGRHRHAVHLHIGVGHHVFGQRRCSEGGADVLFSDSGTIGHRIIEYEVLVALHLAHLGSGLTDALDV